MIESITSKDPFFIPFGASTAAYNLPHRFTFMVNCEPHPLCLLAAEQLQQHLTEQEEWCHNFGLSDGEKGVIIGKMFGVLVVRTKENDIGYLAAFSGKLADGNHHAKFVPPIYDGLTDEGFLNSGMRALTRMNQEIKKLQESQPEAYEEQIKLLKTDRRNHSGSLQKRIYNQYHFLNQAGKTKSLVEIFKTASYKNPPAGAGECAAPKLLQYAFQHNMKPLALAEFWWGLSPRSKFWKHGHFYPCCREKCEPILAHMLSGIKMEQ